MTQHTYMLKHCLLKEQDLSFQCCVAVQQRLTDHELCDNSGNQDELISIFSDCEQSWIIHAVVQCTKVSQHRKPLFGKVHYISPC